MDTSRVRTRQRAFLDQIGMAWDSERTLTVRSGKLHNMGDDGQILGCALEKCMPRKAEAEAFLRNALKVYVSPYGCLSSGCCSSGQDERRPFSGTGRITMGARVLRRGE